MTISMIAALANNRVIGRDNDLPWRLPDDMKYFMQTTKGHQVVMGRKNYESLPPKYQPLPNRTNIVVTHQKDFQAPGCKLAQSVSEAIKAAKESGENELFIIGGAQIYQQAMDHADRLYLTEIDAMIEGDTFFPAFDPKQWQEISRVHHVIDERHAYPFDFVVYERKN